MATEDRVKVTICGGGNGAHTLAGISSMNNQFCVTVLDVFEDESERWNSEMDKKGFIVNFASGDALKQLPGDVKFKVTSDVPEAISSASVVIIVCPAYTHEGYFDLITRYLSNAAIVVGMPGQPGFEYQCLYFLNKYGKRNSVMALETFPWSCRIKEYGHEVSVLGFKDEVRCSLIRQGETTLEPLSMVQKIIGKASAVKEASNVLETCLMAKAILHPPILYARWKDWDGAELESPPLFFQGVDARASESLDGACNEIVNISQKLEERYPQFKGMDIGTVHKWLLDHYSEQIIDKSTLFTCLRTNKAYDGLVHPMTKTSSGKYVPNFTHRFLREDVPYGILIQRAVAEMVGVETPVIDKIITWAQGIMGKEFLVDGKINQKCLENTRIPQRYGLYTIDDVLNFCQSK